MSLYCTNLAATLPGTTDSRIRDQSILSLICARPLKELEKRNEKRKQDFLNLSIEKRRNIFAGNLAQGKSETGENDLRGRMQLLLQPSGSCLHVPERRLTILSPHTTNCTSDALQFSQAKDSNRKSFVLPKLLLPTSESQHFYSR